MTIGHQNELCELCRLAAHRPGRLCSSCAEMIARLSLIALDAARRPSSAQVQGQNRPVQPDRRAQLFERALGMNIFNIADYRRDT
jgi:hypothetical protein